MRALVYEGPRRLVVRDVPRPLVKDGEVEVAVAAAGVCGVDLKGFAGKSRHHAPGLILGHELVGQTADGRRVVVDPLTGCGVCGECRSGRTNLCGELRLLGMGGVAGCMAEFVAVPAGQVYGIPEGIEDARAVLAEPLANIVHLLRLAGLKAGMRVGVVGAGLMGSLAVQLALWQGARAVVVWDVDEGRLAAARRMGAAVAASGDEVDLAVDACGAAEARESAFGLCRPGGTVALLGMATQRSAVDFGAGIRRELRVAMSFGYTAEDFQRAVELLAAGAVDLGEWTAVMPLEEGQAAFERMADARGERVKMVLRVWGTRSVLK